MGSALRTGCWLQYNAFFCILEMHESWKCSCLSCSNQFDLLHCTGDTLPVWTSNPWDLDTFLQIILTLRFNGLQLILLHHRKVNFAWNEVNVRNKSKFTSFLESVHNLVCIGEISGEQIGTGKWRKVKVLTAPSTFVWILKTNDSLVVFTCFYMFYCKRQICFLTLIRLYEEMFAIIF